MQALRGRFLIAFVSSSAQYDRKFFARTNKRMEKSQATQPRDLSYK